MKFGAAFGSAGMLLLAMCGLPLAAVLGDNAAAAVCTAAVPGASMQARTRQGPVGRWPSAQVDNAALIVSVGQNAKVPARGWVVAVATAMQESRLTNLGDLGARNDHDSLGLFQQRPSQGWGSPAQLLDRVYASTAFYKALQRVRSWEALPITVAAQKVQRSAYPDAYAKHEIDAERIVAAVTGAASITELPSASLADCGPIAAVSSGGWTRPVDAPVVSGFRTPGRPTHQGNDLGAGRNTVIRAAAAGKVVFAACDDDTGNCDIDGSPSTPGCGWFVEILHAGQIATRYCHMVRKPEVFLGQRVSAGEPIGLVGTSGHSSGPHLHFEVHIDVTCGAVRCRLSSANAIEPSGFMTARGAPLRGRL
ncbi:M23 family metallopeptidase [Actinoplanes sp. LDG1-06]|uniref:M23 family metallopeptidase n=1 Tax=Paractinoplanes ovalisporus TaxID=2810368 RepID=A0ABS2AU47_9ACTN|nr:M23 family metallopeptidase [Actinoplanes ovalisporus]